MALSPLGIALNYQPPNAAQAAIAPTNVGQIYKNSSDTAMQAYAAKKAQENAMWGGLAGLGSAGISGGPAWMKALGLGANAAAPAAAAPAATAAESLAAPALSGVPASVAGNFGLSALAPAAETALSAAPAAFTAAAPVADALAAATPAVAAGAEGTEALIASILAMLAV